jgi:hypothetical protein
MGELVHVVFHPDAERELNDLPGEDISAIDHAREKLEVFGESLPFPHQSAVRGTRSLRELRPRAGRSRWRAFYRRSGAIMVIAAIGPEARVDRAGFRRAIARAETRLAEFETRGRRRPDEVV